FMTGACFFFQAEDGIRDFHVTGVQTCALPIWDFSEFDDARQEAGAHVTDAVKVKALVDHARLALRGEAPALDAPDGRSFAGTKLDRKSVVEGMMVARGGERVQSISTRSKNRGS